MYEYRAIVRNIVDGDTIDLSVDLGFHMTAAIRFRLTGINAPERWHTGGADATGWLAEQLPIDSEVTIRTNKADSFGRWIALIKRDQDTASINQLMVEAGHAVLYEGRYAAPVLWE